VEPQPSSSTTAPVQQKEQAVAPVGSTSLPNTVTAQQRARTAKIPAASKHRSDDSLGIGINVTIDNPTKKK
jgi:hypothetical protein